MPVFANGSDRMVHRANKLKGQLALLLIVTTVCWSIRCSSQNPEQLVWADEGARLALRVEVNRIAPVEQITWQREFTGSIKAARVSQLSFERSGRVIAVNVDEGSVVEKGQLLSSIDVRKLSATLGSIEAQLEQAKAVLAELVAGPRQEKIAATRAQVAGLNALVNRLQRTFKRSQQLVSKMSVSQEHFDTAKFQLEAGIAERDAGQKQFDELLAGTRVEQLDAQRAVVKQLEAQLRTLHLNLKEGELRAPFAGQIADRSVDEGTFVTAGAAVLQLVENSNLEAWIGIAPSAAEQLPLGTDCEVIVADQPVRARVAALRPRLDLVTRTQNVILTIDAEDTERLLPGQIARLSLPDVIRANGYLLPTTALAAGPRGLWTVYVVEDSQPPTVQQRSVELLYSLGDEALVSGTLQAGDAVVVNGIHRIVSGQEVAIFESHAEVKR